MSGCPVRGESPAAEAESKCPVKGGIATQAGAPATTAPSWLSRLLWGSMESGAPAPTSDSAGAVTGYNEAANDAAFSQSRLPGQTAALSQTRTVSNIPKSSFTPKHQPDGVNKWVYPSEQQYFNAMKRKGYDPPEQDMSVILTIHNTVNEVGWQKILEWEHLRNPGCTPKLMRFLGRPKDLSPKARFLVMLGKEAPFDRHDWFVERDGKEVRYVLDFYATKPAAGAEQQGTAPVHLDVRPALDSAAAFVDRVRWLVTK